MTSLVPALKRLVSVKVYAQQVELICDVIEKLQEYVSSLTFTRKCTILQFLVYIFSNKAQNIHYFHAALIRVAVALEMVVTQ